MAEEIYVDQMHKWENVWSTIKQLSKEEIAKIPKEFLRTSKIPEHKVKIKRWEKSEEIIDNFEDENLSNVVLYDVDVVMENTEESTALSATNNIAPIDQEKAAELMATPAAETSVDSSENASQQNELTISNTVNNSMSNLSTSNSTSSDVSSEKIEPSSTGNVITNASLTNGTSSLRFEILPESEPDSYSEKLPLKKTSTNNEKGSEHVDKRMKLDDGNVKEVVSNKVEDNKPEAKEEQVNEKDKVENLSTSNDNPLKRKADQLENNTMINTSNEETKPTSPTKSNSPVINENKNESKKQNDNAGLDIKENINDKKEIRIRAIPVNTEDPKLKQPQKRMSLFDDQGNIILKPTSFEKNNTNVTNATVEEPKKLEISTSDNNLMDVDNVEKSDKFDAEQSNADSTFGLKSYNSTELSAEGSYKKIVASIEDSNVSSISEISSINNEETLDQSSSVASSNVKRIIERLENNTIHNDQPLVTNDTTDNKDADIKSPEKIEESEETSINTVPIEKSEEVPETIVEDKKNEQKEEESKVHQDSVNDNAVEKEVVKETIVEKEIVEKKIVSDNKVEEVKDTLQNDNDKPIQSSTMDIDKSNNDDKPIQNSTMDVDVSNSNNTEEVKTVTVETTTTVIKNDEMEKKTEIIVKTDENGQKVEEKKETIILNKVVKDDSMDVDEKPKEPIIGGSVMDKIKLFEKSASANENIKEDIKNGEAKLQEIKMTIEKQVEEKESEVEPVVKKSPETEKPPATENPFTTEIIKNESSIEQEKKETPISDNAAENVVQVTTTTIETTITKTQDGVSTKETETTEIKETTTIETKKPEEAPSADATLIENNN